MKKILLTTLVASLAAGTKGMNDNQAALVAGLQNDRAQAVLETANQNLAKEFATKADVLNKNAGTYDESFAGIVAGLQSQISSIMQHAGVAGAELADSNGSAVLNFRSKFAKPGETGKVKPGDLQSSSYVNDYSDGVAGLQSFSSINVDTFAAFSTAYNVAASKQSPFAEAYFKSIMLDPTVASFDLEINVIQTFANVQAELGANPYEKGLKSLIKQISDGTSLVKEETRLYPIDRNENADKIVSALSWSQMIDGVMHDVAPIKSGVKIGILSAAITTQLAAGGTQDSSDSLTNEARVTDLFLPVTGMVGDPAVSKTDYLKLPILTASLNKFVRKVNGRATEMGINEVFSAVYSVKELKTYVHGTGNGVLDGLADTYALKFEIRLTGLLDIQDGNVSVDPKVTLVAVLDATGKDVTGNTSLTDITNIKDIFTMVPKIPEGYNLECYRLNDNLRQTGQRITQNTYYASFPLSYHAPRHVDTPVINFAGSNGDKNLETSVNYTGFEMDQVAVKSILDFVAVIRQVANSTYSDDELYKIIGPAAYFVNPAAEIREVNVQNILSSATSSGFNADIRAAICYQVRDLAIKLVTDSVLTDALRIMTGDDTILVSVGIHESLSAYVAAEIIDLPKNYKVLVESTNNSLMMNKILVTASRESSSADKANVLDRGWMVWYPDVAASLQIQEGAAKKNTFVYIPGYTHINNLPIAGIIDLVGLDTITRKAAQRVARINDSGAIINS